MTENLDGRIGLYLRDDDITTIEEVSLEERRTKSSVLRNLFDDIASGVIPIDIMGTPKVQRSLTTARVSLRALEALADIEARTNLTQKEIVDYAFDVFRDQRANRPPKSNEDRLEDLKHRHRHSNSPIPDDLDPERETKTAA